MFVVVFQTARRCGSGGVRSINTKGLWITATVITAVLKPPHPQNWPRLSFAGSAGLPRFAGDYCNPRPANEAGSRAEDGRERGCFSEKRYTISTIGD